MKITQEVIIEKLKAGWELRMVMFDGSCKAEYWLNSPSIPYERGESYPVDTQLISSMEAQKVIRWELLTRTARARLVEVEA